MRDSATSISNRDSDAIHIGALYRSAEKSACESVRQLLEVGQRLYEKKQSLPHGAWLPWLAENANVLGFGQRAASRLVMARHKFKLDASVSFDEKKALQVSREIWGHSPVRGTAGTGENEWFTPPEFLELARTVLGVIDLDPASSDKAQEVVQAEQYFAKADDGLAKQWHGRVWLNPPYAQPFIAQFVAKLVAEIEAGAHHRRDFADPQLHRHRLVSCGGRTKPRRDLFHARACQVFSPMGRLLRRRRGRPFSISGRTSAAHSRRRLTALDLSSRLGCGHDCRRQTRRKHR